MATEQDRLVTVIEVVDRYSKEMNKMRDEFEKTTKQLEKTSKEVLEVGNNGADSSGGISKLVASFVNLKSVLITAGLGLITKAIKDVGMKCIEAASDMNELENITTQVFERSSAEIQKWADDIDTAVGRSVYKLQNYASIYGSMFKGAGFETDVFKEWSKDLTKLTADFSSFFNVADEEAFVAIKGVLTGEAEAMKRYGFILNETTMAEYAYSHGVKEKWSNLSEAEKMQLRYNALMEKTAHIQGDAERTIDGYANQLKVAEAHITNISGALGQKMLPSVEGALHMFNDFAQIVEDFTKKRSYEDYAMDFTQEKAEIQSLYAEYEKLSKLPARDTKQEERRLQIFNQLSAKYPELFSNISNEASKYKQVEEAVNGVIKSLKEKILLQMNEDFFKDMTQKISDVQKKIKDVYAKAGEKTIQIEAKYNINTEQIEKLKSEIEKLQKEDNMSWFDAFETSIKNVLDTHEMTRKQVTDMKTDLISYFSMLDKAKYVEEKETKALETYLKTQEKTLDVSMSSFEKLTDLVSGSMNTISKKMSNVDEKIKNTKQEVINSRKRVEGEVWTSTGESMGQTVRTGGDVDANVITEHIRTRAMVGQSISYAIGGIMTTIKNLGNDMFEVSTKNLNKNGNGNLLETHGLNSGKPRILTGQQVAEENRKNIGLSTQKKLDEINKNVKKMGGSGKGSGGGGKSKGSGGGSGKGKENKNKWESQVESLEKSLKDLQTPIDKFKHKIDELNMSINNLEVKKLAFAAQYGNAKNSDVLTKELEGLKKLQQTAIEASDSSTTADLKLKIKEKEFLIAQSKFLEDLISGFEKKTEQLKFNFRNPDETTQKAVAELHEKATEYYEALVVDTREKRENGLLTEAEAQKQLSEIFKSQIEVITKIKDYSQYVNLRIGNILQERKASDIGFKEEAEMQALKENTLGSNIIEKTQNSIKLIEQQRDKYLNDLVEFHKLLGAKSLKEEDRKKIEEELNKTEVKIKEFVSVVKDNKLFSDLAQSLNSLDFGKSLNENISKVIEEQVKEANKQNGVYIDVTKDISRIVKEKVSDLGGMVKEDDIQRIRNTVIEEQIKIYTEKGEVEKAEILKRMQFNNALDNLNTQFGKLGNIFSQLGNITGSQSMNSMAGIMNSMQGFGNALKGAGIGSLKDFGKLFTGGFNFSNILSGVGVITSGLGIVNSVLSFGKSAKKKAAAENEQRRQQADAKYNEDYRKNEELTKAIKDLTNSIQDMTVKVIENISKNTSDENINRQTNYYKHLIDSTGAAFNENIIASGHSNSRKRKGFRKVTNTNYGNFNTSFDEYFGSIWQNWKRDSASLQQFYDQYLQNFNLHNLRMRLGTQYLDKNNIEQVKKNFLTFIESMRTMENYAKTLPKNGLLASFEGMNVTDMFQQRKEYEEQLKNIYKTMGRDPEQYRLEIIQKVNELVKGDKIITTAFDQVRNSVIEQMAEGNKAIDGLTQGLRGYFNNISKNFSKMIYDMNIRGVEEEYNAKFKEISEKLVEMRQQGHLDIGRFVGENMDFTSLFTRLKSVDHIHGAMKTMVENLRRQARDAGLSEEMINTMFPDSKLQEKINKIQNALKTAMERALDTNSYNQFTMSLGDSIYQNVKEGLVTAFTESAKYKQLMEKYFIDNDYKRLIDQATNFKDAYELIKRKQNQVEDILKSQGLDFRGTNAVNGEYLGGMRTQESYARTRIANEQASFNFNLNIENKGFLAVNDLTDYLKKEIKKFLHKAKKEEA